MKPKTTTKPKAPTKHRQVGPCVDTYETIELSTIIVNPAANCRIGPLDLEEIQRLAESISTDGLQMPLVVRPDGDKRILVSGYRRHAALTLLGRTHVTARLLAVDQKEARIKNWVENVARQDLTPPEMARRAGELVDDGVTVEEMERRTGLSPTHLRNLIRLRKQLVPALWEEFARGAATYEDPNQAAEGTEVSHNPQPMKRINWRFTHFCACAARPAADQRAYHAQQTAEEEAKQAAKAARKEAKKEAKKNKKESGDGESEPEVKEDPIAWIVTRPQAARLRAWLSVARTDPALVGEWLDGVEALLGYFSQGEPLGGSTQTPDLSPLVK